MQSAREVAECAAGQRRSAFRRDRLVEDVVDRQQTMAITVISVKRIRGAKKKRPDRARVVGPRILQTRLVELIGIEPTTS